MRYEVRATSCNCHPETCCCHDYEIIWRSGMSEKCSSIVIAKGSNKIALTTLVDAANKPPTGAGEL